MGVMDDLLSDVDRRTVEIEEPFHGLDRTLNAGAVAPWRRKEYPLDHATIVSGALSRFEK
jgi:hypothetical protein